LGGIQVQQIARTGGEINMPAAPIIFGREFFEVDPRSTALIVIDMQNAFVAEGAR
jgi:hypothetical protein